MTFYGMKVSLLVSLSSCFKNKTRQTAPLQHKEADLPHPRPTVCNYHVVAAAVHASALNQPLL